MKSSKFHLRVSRVDRLAEAVIHLTGDLVSGEIQPECSAIIGETGLELIIKGVVLIHPPNQASHEVAVMVEKLPMQDCDLVGKDLFSSHHDLKCGNQ